MNLAQYSLPIEYEFRDSLPKTLVGKVAFTKVEDDTSKKIEVIDEVESELTPKDRRRIEKYKLKEMKFLEKLKRKREKLRLKELKKMLNLEKKQHNK